MSANHKTALSCQPIMTPGTEIPIFKKISFILPVFPFFFFSSKSRMIMIQRVDYRFIPTAASALTMQIFYV